VYSSIYFSVRPGAMENDMWIFNTPDETANFFFIEKLAKENTLKYYEPLNEISGDLNLVRPRSTTVVNNHIVPGSFLGFLLVMGVIAKIFSSWLIPFIIPLFSVLAVICFYFILKKIFKENVAFLSAILLLMTPAFWYYNSRSLFNNVLFIDFLIIATWLLFRFFDSKKKNLLIFSGLLFGLALSIRVSDLVWVVILVASIFIYQRKGIFWRDWIIMMVSVFLSFLPVLLIQNNIYGSPFVTGYTPSIGESLSGGSFYFNLIKQVFAPFGINMINAFSNFYHFFVAMFPFHFWLAFLGGVLIAYRARIKSLNKKEKYYFVVAIIISMFVMIYYGSWIFFDNVFGSPLIGSSQTRYMLPIYILSLPFISYLVNFVSLKIKFNKAKNIFVLLFVTIFLYFSANIVLYEGQESLYSVKNTIIGYHQINKQVRELIDDDAVIVTSYNDKLFFPARKIIFYWNEPRFLDNISLIVNKVPVYFYSIDLDNDINYITDNSTLNTELILKINERENFLKLHP